jgi:hypothetical protein
MTHQPRAVADAIVAHAPVTLATADIRTSMQSDDTEMEVELVRTHHTAAHRQVHICLRTLQWTRVSRVTPQLTPRSLFVCPCDR